MSNWNDLSMKEKAAMMKVAVSNGIYKLSDIKKAYNEYAEGGPVIEGGELPEVTVAPNNIYLHTYRPLIDSDYKITGHSALIAMPPLWPRGKNGEFLEPGIIISNNGRNPNYNLLLNNCSDATRRALEAISGDSLNPAFFTTPGDVKDFAEDKMGGVTHYRDGHYVTTIPISLKEREFLHSFRADDPANEGVRMKSKGGALNKYAEGGPENNGNPRPITTGGAGYIPPAPTSTSFTFNPDRIVQDVPAREWGPTPISFDENGELNIGEQGEGNSGVAASMYYYLLQRGNKLGDKNIEIALNNLKNNPWYFNEKIPDEDISFAFSERKPGFEKDNISKATADQRKALAAHYLADSESYLNHAGAMRRYFGKDDLGVLRESTYKPGISKDPNSKYYIFNNMLAPGYWNPVMEDLVQSEEKSKHYYDPTLNEFTASKGHDNTGDYVSIYDVWDYNTRVVGRNSNSSPDNIKHIVNGKPFDIYHRIYLDDYYGTPEDKRGSYFLPEVTITPDKKSTGGPLITLANEFSKGGKIYIKPENRGKFTRLKERTGHSASWFKLHGTPAQKKMATFALNARKWKHGEGGPLIEAANIYEDGGTKDISGTRKAWYIDFKRRNGKAPSYLDNVKRNLYNLVNPAEGYPKSVFELLVEKPVQAIAAALLPNTVKVRRGGNEEPASEAAWAKRMGIPYNESLIINNGDDSYSLSRQYEQEIPVDTVAIKKRIEANQKLADSPNIMGEQWRLLNEYINADKNTLDSLRHTYATGEPVVINEFSYNSRKAMDENGNVVPVTSPLNVLQNYTIQYDKENNAMNYRDIYDFNQFEPFVPGEPFNFKGTIPLKKEYGGPLVNAANKYYR